MLEKTHTEAYRKQGFDFSFTPPDNGRYHVVCTASDEDGGSTRVSKWIDVQNLPPTIDSFTEPLVVAEGQPLSVWASISDPGGRDTHTFFWQVTDASEQVVHSGTQAVFEFAPPDNGTYRVTFTATDKDGDSGTAQATFTATNVPPTATFSGDTQAVYGQAVTVRFTDPFDPSPADTATGFHYSFAFDPFELQSVTYLDGSTADDSWTIQTLKAGKHTIYGRIIDKDDGYSEYTTTVIVSKAHATIEIDDASCHPGVIKLRRLANKLAPGFFFCWSRDHDVQPNVCRR